MTSDFHTLDLELDVNQTLEEIERVSKQMTLLSRQYKEEKERLFRENETLLRALKEVKGHLLPIIDESAPLFDLLRHAGWEYIGPKPAEEIDTQLSYTGPDVYFWRHKDDPTNYVPLSKALEGTVLYLWERLCFPPRLQQLFEE